MTYHELSRINRGAVNGFTFDEMYDEFQDTFNGFTRFCEMKTREFPSPLLGDTNLN